MEDIPIQVFVSEFALRIVQFNQASEVGKFFVQATDLCTRHGSQLSPMGSGLERQEGVFDDWKECTHAIPILAPGEMDANTGLSVAGAHPEFVGGDGSNLRDVKEGGYLLP